VTSTLRQFALEPCDTLFCRDGRPFNQDDESQADAHSLFPPFPTTLSGALRAALARSRGWTGRGLWSSELSEVLGDGPDHLGRLRFSLPLPVRRTAETKSGWERLYPAPRHLVGLPPVDEKGAWTGLTLLRPGEARTCDLGPNTRLPVLPDKAACGTKPVDHVWLTATALEAVLTGRAPEPDQLVPQPRLWTHEPRIGLARDPGTRLAVTGQLYASAHVRPAAGVGLGVTVAGLPPDWEPASPSPLGGEHRMAWVTAIKPPLAAPPSHPPVAPARAPIRYAVVFLTPGRPTGHGWLRPGGQLDPALPGAVVAVCADRPVLIGGWDSRHDSFGPRPLRPFLPAGSVVFLELAAGTDQTALINPPGAIGEDTGHGFGHIVLGTWS